MPTDPQNQQLPKKKPLDNYLKYSAISVQIAVTVFALTYGGIKLDEYLNLKFPFFTLILSMFSVVAALYLTLKDFIKKKP